MKELSQRANASCAEVITSDLACSDCGYCLKGLPRKSRCPECGFGYVADPISEEQACELFVQRIPAVLRLGLKPSHSEVIPFIYLPAQIAVAAAVAALVVGGVCLGTLIGFAFSEPMYPPQRNIVAQFGIFGTHGGKVRWHEGMWYYATLLFWGQFLTSISISVLYFRRSVALGLSGWVMRRYAFYAGIGSAYHWLIVGLLVSIWQIPNVITPLARREWYFDIVSWRHRFYLPHGAWQLLGATTVIVLSGCLAVWFVRTHGRFTRELRQRLLGVRPVSD